MKLSVVHINAEQGSGPYAELVNEVFNSVKRSDTEIVHKFAKLKRATDTVFGYPYMLNAVDVANNIANEGRAGAEGIMVACSGDPGIIEARTLVDVPVVGPWEASLHLAAMYGYRFGVITVADQAWVETCHSLVAKSGLINRCVGVQPISIPSAEAFTEGFTNPDRVLAEIDKQARKLVDMGASAICIGSAGLSTIASAGGLTKLSGLDVPVFDTLVAGLKTLEMRVDLHQRGGLPATSRSGYTTRLPDADIDRVQKLFGY